MSALDAAERAVSASEGGEPVVLVTVVTAPNAENVGARLAVTASSMAGTLGNSDLDVRAVEIARAALDSRERCVRKVEFGRVVWELYLEPQYPQLELVIVGAGHIARPLCKIAALMEFRVTVLDDRPEFADPKWFPGASRILSVEWDDPFKEIDVAPDTFIVLVTRGHKYDYDCIQQLLEMEVQPAYLGMIGSRRRVRAAFEALVGAGVAPARLQEVRAPIGLDIGAETPEEIAVAIAAELISVRRGGGGAALTQQEHVLARVARRHETSMGKNRPDV